MYCVQGIEFRGKELGGGGFGHRGAFCAVLPWVPVLYCVYSIGSRS